MVQEMRRDAELLGELLDKADSVVDRAICRNVTFSVKVIAHWTGFSVKTISDYRIGKTNIPVDFWRRILEHHFDIRIVRLLVPDVIDFEVACTKYNVPDTTLDFFRKALQAEAAHHEAMKRVADILADNRINELDEHSINLYDASYHDHRQLEFELHRSIIARFNMSMAGSAV